jgi:hypothetical protein
LVSPDTVGPHHINCRWQVETALLDATTGDHHVIHRQRWRISQRCKRESCGQGSDKI